MQGMRHPGVGKRAAAVTAAFLLTCLAVPSALADETPTQPPPPADTASDSATPPPPASSPPADEDPASGPTPVTSGQSSVTATPSSDVAASSGTTLLATKRGGVSIADFSFSPASITVGVGETVTWSNNGPSDHTVTAEDGSFDSGTMADGDSFAHTFSQAGTFAYVCAIHDEMKGTVVVSSGGSGPTSGDNTNGDTTGTDPGTTGPTSESAAGQSPTAAGTTDSLPSTGQNEVPLFLLGVALLAAGGLLTRLGRRRA
jgi:LPXTG-motif cell wall-anchored protein